MLWFDLDNSPHVPLFRPVFAELNRRSVKYIVTARDFAQTKSLLELWNIESTILGTHGGKNTFMKVLNLLQRSQKLVGYARRRNVSLAISHGSRTQLVAAKRLGIKSILMLDYEYTEHLIFNALATILLMPALIPEKRLKEAGFNLRKVIRYDGFKEELYLNDFIPDQGFRKSMQIDQESILVILRPPAALGNYHDRGSEALYAKCLEYFSSIADVQCIVVNRSGSDRNDLPFNLRGRKNITLLDRAVDGLQLIWSSDLVVSGGGTMNRESALLGVPTYSIFTGRRPSLDEHLRDEGKLTFVESIQEVERIPVVKRNAVDSKPAFNGKLITQVTDLLIEQAEKSNSLKT